MKKKRLLVVFAGMALLISTVLLFNPYPRQLLLGPTFQGIPLSGWQNDFRTCNGRESGDPFFARILDWLNHDYGSLDWSPLSKTEKAAIYISLAEDPSPRVSQGVMRSLLAMQSKEEFTVALRFLDDPDKTVLKETCFHIGFSEASFEAALPKLKAMLGNTDPERRIQDIKTIAAHHTNRLEILEMLVHMLEDPVSQVRLESLDHLGDHQWSRKRMAKIALPKVMECLQDGDALCRVAGAMAVWNITKQSKDIFPVYRKELHNPDAKVRAKAVAVIRSIGKNRLLAWDELVFCALKDENINVKKDAIEALFVGGQKAVPILLFLLNHEEPKVKERALFALIRIGPQANEAAPLLLSRVRELGDLALTALGRMKAKEAIPTFIVMLKENDHHKGRLVSALGDIGPTANVAIPMLMEMLRGSDRGMRRTAAVALAKIGGKPTKVVAALMDSFHDADNFADEDLADGFKHLGPLGKEAIPALTKLLHSPKTFEPDRAAFYLGFIGAEAKSAIPDLLQLLTKVEKSPWTRLSAAEALGKINQDAPKVVPALIPFLQEKEKYDWTRLHTIKAMARFGPQAMDAVPSLIALLADDDDEVSEEAANALSAIDPERFPKKENGS